MEQNAWFSDAKSVSSLEAEVCFLLAESFYYGPDTHPDIVERKLVEKLPAPNIPLKVTSMVRVSEAIGYEQQLADYYTQVIRLARKHHMRFQRIRHYFWLRFWLWNNQEGIYISFPWYDSFSEIDRFLNALSKVEEGEVDYDMDQGWEMEVWAKNETLYIRQRDPDADEVHLAISVPRAALVSQIAPLRERTKKVISGLSQAVGSDVWTTYFSGEEPPFSIPHPWWKVWKR